jgi:hypothetical protein
VILGKAARADQAGLNEAAGRLPLWSKYEALEGDLWRAAGS